MKAGICPRLKYVFGSRSFTTRGTKRQVLHAVYRRVLLRFSMIVVLDLSIISLDHSLWGARRALVRCSVPSTKIDVKRPVMQRAQVDLRVQAAFVGHADPRRLS